jgi:hypothetical protein
MCSMDWVTGTPRCRRARPTGQREVGDVVAVAGPAAGALALGVDLDGAAVAGGAEAARRGVQLEDGDHVGRGLLLADEDERGGLVAEVKGAGPGAVPVVLLVVAVGGDGPGQCPGFGGGAGLVVGDDQAAGSGVGQPVQASAAHDAGPLVAPDQGLLGAAAVGVEQGPCDGVLA